MGETQAMDEVKKPDALEPAEAVLRFLSSVASSAEAEFYLRLFRERARESFAAIAVTTDALERGADSVALDLCFLHALGLTPIVVLGLDRPKAVQAHAARLGARLQEDGVTTEALTTTGPYPTIAAAARRGAIPILHASGANPDARLEGLARLLREFEIRKLIYLRPEGGLSLRGERLSVVNLNTDYDAMLANSELTAQSRRLLEISRRLVLELCPGLHVSVTSPLNLLRELFTVKGAGTMLRTGARIERHAGYASADRERLLALLTSSFGKAPNPALFQRPLTHLYVEESYRGAAMLLDTELGAYLSKFSVTREAQGEGIGQDLWNAFSADHGAVFWRSRHDNPIRPWYERQCQGRYAAGAWTVYFRGLTPAQIEPAIRYALAQPADF
jgi:bifunctional N-acetylglutamate synthase/kinase